MPKNGAREPGRGGRKPVRQSTDAAAVGILTRGAVTPRVDVSQRLQLRERQQAAVAALGRMALTGTPLSTLLDEAAQALADHLSCKYSKILELQAGGTGLLLRAGVGWQKGLVGKTLLGTGRDSQAGFTLENGGPIIVEDLSEETRFDFSGLLGKHRVLSGLGVIIGPEAAPWGVLSAHSDRPRHYTVDDVSFLQSVANLLYEAIVRDQSRAILTEREQRLRLALGAAQMGTWEWSPAVGAIVADRRTCELLDVEAVTAATPETLFARVHDEDRAPLSKSLIDALQQDDGFEQRFRVVAANGAVRWVAVRGAALMGHGGRPARLLGVTFDITESKQAEEALRRSEERFQLAVGAVAGLVYDWDLRTGEVYRSDGMFDLIGVRPGPEVSSHDWWSERLHPDDRERALGELSGWLESDEEYFSHEYQLRHADGSWVHIWDQGRILRDAEGRPVRVVGSSTDISDRKKAEERQRMLMAELDHRVKNILANISAIANRTSQRSLSVTQFIKALEGRIRAMAMAHSLLSAARWEGANLRALLEEELAPFTSPSGEKIKLQGPEVLLRPKAAQSLALALHELVTNAAKHGALSTPDGRVEVAWHTEDSEEPARLRLIWQETNGPRAAAPEEKGFGLTVLQDMIAHDLAAEVDLLFPTSGLVCTVTFPVTHTVANGNDGEAMSPPALCAPSAHAQGGGDSCADACEARRLLLVEDAWVVGVQLKTILEVMGHEVIGPATTLEEGLALAGIEHLDGAILDIRLDEENVFPVAEKLRERQVPFGFATGYTDEHYIPAGFRDVPRISKPYSDGNIRELIGQLFPES